MEQQADYIQRIEINGLWGRFNIRGIYCPEVNILSGIQRSGKDDYSEPVRWDTRTAFGRYTTLR